MLNKVNQAAYVALACLFLSPTLALAAPVGGEVVRGDANISYDGPVTNIDQSSQKATINWDGFSVAPSETVNFNQPNANAMTLNRVIGNEKSVIEGAINANGKVYLINSNGVLFTGGSQVNVGGLVASTLNITDDDFMNGNFVFESDNNNPTSVINQGEIIATDGGYVALMGGEVHNEGLIVASLGTVSLNSGKKVTLNFKGDSLLSATIDEAALASLVANKGAIIADGGLVIMTAKAAGDILSAQVNNEGLVQARTISDLNGDYQQGEILLYAYDGMANIAGRLDASAPNGGDGGFIETSGDSVKIADDTVITTLAANGQTGTWLIDPTDFTIAASGGDITGATLSSQLESTDVVIESQHGANSGNGDIYVNDKVEWNANTTLTLDALNDIFINNAMTINGANAGLVMNFGGDYHILTKASFSGVNVVDPTIGVPGAGALTAKEDTSGGVYGNITFTNTANTNGLEINGQQYTLLHDISDFSAIDTNLGGHYALAQNIVGGSHTDSVVTGEFIGTFAGLGHVIDGLVINGSGGNSGLFAVTGDGVYIRDLGLTGVNVNNPGGGRKAQTGALIGLAKGNGNVYNTYVEGSISGDRHVGGLIGQAEVKKANDVFTIGACFADVTVIGNTNLGGLLGAAGTSIKSGMVNLYTCHATGNVISTAENIGPSMGGLAGSATGNVDACYASSQLVIDNSSAKSGGNLGGLIGNYYSTNGRTTYLTNSFATGTIGMPDSSKAYTVGGLVGTISANNTGANVYIYNCYATGDIYSGYSDLWLQAGGLVGRANYHVFFSYVHATGNVTMPKAGNGTGGLIGFIDASLDDLDKMTLEYGYATGNVTSTDGDNVGGLVGLLRYANISNCYATGNVVGSSAVGGLVGSLSWGGSIQNSAAYGNVHGKFSAGGLVGWAYTSDPRFALPEIHNSSASGDVHVTGNQIDKGCAGGLVGSGAHLIISNSSATGSVTNNNGPTPGLIGREYSVSDKGGNIYTDVKAEAAAAAYNAYKQQTMSNASAIANTTEQETRQFTQDAPLMDMVASSGNEQQYIPGLYDGLDGNTGFNWGRGNVADGEPLTLSMLGKKLFSASVNIIITDEGDVYDLTTEE